MLPKSLRQFGIVFGLAGFILVVNIALLTIIPTYAQTTDGWTKSVLFAGGCYFAQKQDYIVYFDSLEAYVPDDMKVSRYYRYDFPATVQGDTEACQAMRDSLATGKLFLLYSGDGDRWYWGGLTERVLRSSMIDNLDNAGKLPIVLSISCSNGWFDNVTQTYFDGGVDCFAERLLT